MISLNTAIINIGSAGRGHAFSINCLLSFPSWFIDIRYSRVGKQSICTILYSTDIIDESLAAEDAAHVVAGPVFKSSKVQ